jgi:hypothetical protein
MTQIFSPAGDIWMRLFLIGIASVAMGSIAGAIGYARSDYYAFTNRVPPQPVPFSHKHHVSGLGLDCRFCHSGVGTGRRAELPPTETCMTCHSQLWTNATLLAPVRNSFKQNKPIVWQRVARVPDYVFFRHDIHIAKGVGCVTCHGHVEDMPLTYRAVPLTMKFCLDCHRNPAPNLRPHDRITDMKWKPEKGETKKLFAHSGIDPADITHCYTCHR